MHRALKSLRSRRKVEPATGVYIAGDIAFRLTRKAVKNINLRINRDGEVCVSASKHVPLYFIHDFVIENRTWISERKAAYQRAKIEAEKAAKLPKYKPGSEIKFWGIAYRIEFSSARKITINTLDDRLIIGHPNIGALDLNVALDPNIEASIEKQLNEWFRVQLKSEIPVLLKKWIGVTKAKPAAWAVRKMRTKWGSCNITEAKITLSLDLIHYPRECLEYVIVHELTHLYERYHNTRFYKLQDTFMPGWRHYENILNSADKPLGF